MLWIMHPIGAMGLQNLQLRNDETFRMIFHAKGKSREIYLEIKTRNVMEPMAETFYADRGTQV